MRSGNPPELRAIAGALATGQCTGNVEKFGQWELKSVMRKWGHGFFSVGQAILQGASA